MIDDGKIRSFQDLDIWKRSVDLAERIYATTKSFPPGEVYGLTPQLRRAAVSVPSNIVEGFGRFHNKEYIQFLFVSLGSCAEATTQLIIAKKLGYIEDSVAGNLVSEIEQISKMTMTLIKKLRQCSVH